MNSTRNSQGNDPSKEDPKPTSTGARSKKAKPFKPSNVPMERNAPSRQRDPTTRRRPEIEGEPDFTPKALSTSFTVPKNDPCDLDAFSVLDLAGLAYRKSVPKVQLNYSGFLDLVDATYRDLGAKDRYWYRNITESSWNYYCTILLWERLLFIKTSQGDYKESALSDFRSMLPQNVQVPKAIASYLAAIGPFTDTVGQKWHIAIPDIVIDKKISLQGFFGKVSHLTHATYGSTPSPGVAALAVCFELLAPDNVIDWNLPQALRPEGEIFSTPTRNLLGWQPKSGRPISTEARNLLGFCGIDGNYNPVTGEIDDLAFGTDNGDIPVNYQLLNHISGRLGAISDKTPLITGFVETLVGSQTQLGFVIPAITSLGKRSTNQIIQPRCSTQLISARGNAIAVFKLRVEYPDDPSSYIYRLNTDQEIPDEWVDSLNSVFTAFDAERINGDEFGITNVDGKAAVAEFVANIAGKHKQ